MLEDALFAIGQLDHEFGLGRVWLNGRRVRVVPWPIPFSTSLARCSTPYPRQTRWMATKRASKRRP